MGLITLLTDFGLEDEYVGVLKGVILGINPDARIVDLSHGIDPQDVLQAAYLLKSAYPYFPKGTIHVAVIDPGVGSQRAILAARFDDYVFLAPDNGLLNGLWEDRLPDMLVKVQNTALCLNPISHSFHGRDIFAPVAAHLSLGMAITELGPTIAWDQTVGLTSPMVTSHSDDRIDGQVIAIDHFGNLVTNISAARISHLNPQEIALRVGNHCIIGLSQNYSQAQAGQALALIGSRQLIEIAINRASAAQQLDVAKGAAVFISLEKQAKMIL